MYKTKYDVLKKSKEAIGKTFGEIDQHHRLDNSKNKGGLGQLIEESLFGYEINSRAEADFVEAGVELKVTPMKLNKNGTYSAKERLVLNIIDYNKEVKLEFDNSSFWKKNHTLLLMFYLNDFAKYKRDMIIQETILYEYPMDDLAIIKKDYEIIVDKIIKGKAHELSEADTMYLGACSKGANSSSLRKQPFSDILAMQRAFSLKQSYMTYVVRKYIVKKEINDKIIIDTNCVSKQSFEEYVHSQIIPYLNNSVEQLRIKFQISTNAKSFRAMLISKMLKVKNISKSTEFVKSGMKFKTIKVEKSGSIKESMSFPYFEFTDLVNEEWEDSTIRNMFLSTKFVFAVFRIGYDGIEKFQKLVFWRMPIEDLDVEYKKVFVKTKEVLLSGNIVKDVLLDKNYKEHRISNFPGSLENMVGHVRPHAINALDVSILPITDNLLDIDSYTKHSFWLNSRYIKHIVR